MVRGSLAWLVLATLCVPTTGAEMVSNPAGLVAQVPYGYFVLRQAREVAGVWATHVGAVAQDQEDLALCALPFHLPREPCPPDGLICTTEETTLRIRLTNWGANADVLTLRAEDFRGMSSATAEGFGSVAESVVTQGSGCPWVWIVGTYVPVARTPYTLVIDGIL